MWGEPRRMGGQEGEERAGGGCCNKVGSGRNKDEMTRKCSIFCNRKRGKLGIFLHVSKEANPFPFFFSNPSSKYIAEISSFSHPVPSAA